MIVATQKEAAKQLGVTQRQLRNWLGEPWFPANGRGEGGYDVGAIKAARDAEGRKGSEQNDVRGKLRDALSAEKLKRVRIETRQQEIKLAEAEARLIPREAIELYIATFNTRFGDWCDQVPDIVAREAPAKFRKKVRDRLKRELNERRTALRAELEAKARELDQRAPDADRTGSDGSEQ